MKIGDIVYYKNDFKGKRPWCLYDINENGLCTIVLIRNDKITNNKNGEERLNASIVNLNISELYE